MSLIEEGEKGYMRKRRQQWRVNNMVNSIPHSSSPLISGTGLYSEISCHYVEHQSIDFATLAL